MGSAFDRALAASFGRPRAVLHIGDSDATLEAHATRVGARLVATRAASDAVAAHRGMFDLLTIEPTAFISSEHLSAWSSCLTDGGHVLVPYRAGVTTDDAIAQVRAAGLEPMRVDNGWRVSQRFAPRTGFVVVARKHPAPGPLTLTIGMLTLNEHESIERMIDEVRVYAPDAKVLVVDSSSDRTPELAAAKGARVIRQVPPRGHGPAMERLMYEAARDTEALIYLDCDFTYPADQIPRLRALLEAGADMVNATRTHTKPEAMPIPNFIANRVFAATAELVHGIATTDVHSGMRAYRSSMVRGFAFDGEGDALPLDTLILPARSNYDVIETPIAYHKRVGESKLARVRGTLWSFARIASAIGKGTRVQRGGSFRHLANESVGATH
jgi:hypothetical protein